MAPTTSLTRTQVIADARSRLHEPTDGRYFDDDPEMYLWYNMTIDEIARKVGYERETLSFLGNDGTYFVSALGTDPRFYTIPDNYMMIDPDYGIKINGIRQLGSSNREIDLFQQKGVTEALNSTIYIDDYFTESYSGLVAYYITEYVLKEDIDAGRKGWLISFQPSPGATDTISIRFLTLPAYPTVGGDSTNLMRQFAEALVLGVTKRGKEKQFNDALISQASLLDTRNEFDKMIDEMKEYVYNLSHPDKIYKVKTARQAYGMYKSATTRRQIYGQSRY